MKAAEGEAHVNCKRNVPKWLGIFQQASEEFALPLAWVEKCICVCEYIT